MKSRDKQLLPLSRVHPEFSQSHPIFLKSHEELMATSETMTSTTKTRDAKDALGKNSIYMGILLIYDLQTFYIISY